MVEFIAIVASFLYLGQFFLSNLLKPELIVPADNRSTLIYVVYTSANLFWTMYGLITGITLVAACFGVILLFNSVVLYIRMFIKPKPVKIVPYFPQPRLLKSDKVSP
jgi:hypothetical protein